MLIPLVEISFHDWHAPRDVWVNFDHVAKFGVQNGKTLLILHADIPDDSMWVAETPQQILERLTPDRGLAAVGPGRHGWKD